MYVIEKPDIYFVGMSNLNDTEFNRFLKDHDIKFESDAESHGDALSEIAGRLCYMSFAKPRPGGNEKYLDHIKESGHGSVLEHPTYSFIFSGISRSLSHELVRHRAGFAYSQLSQRFFDESEAEFVMPPVMLGMSEHIKTQWLEICKYLLHKYNWLVEQISFEGKGLDRKQIREAARSVLPNATETKIFVTANARAWRHFLEMRGTLLADAEIRRLACRLLPILASASPNIYGDYELAIEEESGREFIRTDFRKI